MQFIRARNAWRFSVFMALLITQFGVRAVSIYLGIIRLEQ